MDRHQPAYWLSRDPAEAADFLARTAVASRAVGGFIKTAQGTPSWLTPEMKWHLTNAAMGAGVGGLGGLGIGLFSRRKKNPLASALTGAAVGGVLGGALPAGWQAYKNIAKPPAVTPAAMDLKQLNEQALKESPWFTRLGVAAGAMAPPTVDPAKVPVPGGPAAAGGGAPPPQGETVMDVLREGAGNVAGGVKNIAGNAVGNVTSTVAPTDRPVTGAALAAAALASHGAGYEAIRRIKNNIDTFNRVQAGYTGLPAYKPGTPAVEGLEPIRGSDAIQPIAPQPGSLLSVQPGNARKVTMGTPGVRGVRSGPHTQGVQEKPAVPAENPQTHLMHEHMRQVNPLVGDENDWLRQWYHKNRLGGELNRMAGRPEGTRVPGTPSIIGPLPQGTERMDPLESGTILEAKRLGGKATAPAAGATPVPRSRWRRWGGPAANLIPYGAALGTYMATEPR